jgi:hypothetical protein
MTANHTFRYRHGWVKIDGTGGGGNRSADTIAARVLGGGTGGDLSSQELSADYRSKVKLRPYEEEALDRYTTSKFVGINAHLRGEGGQSAEAQADAGVLQALADRYQTPASMTTYRGIKGSSPFPAGDLTGTYLEDKGFASTAVGRPQSPFDKGPDMLEITVPKGTHGVAVNGTDQGFQDEHEFILPPGTRFRVDSQEVVQIPGGWGPQRRLKVTAFPPAPPAAPHAETLSSYYDFRDSR